MYALLASLPAIPEERILAELEFIEHIWRVLGAALARRVHLAGVISLDTALLVTAKSIPSQVGILVVEIALGAIRLFRRGSLRGVISCPVLVENGGT